MLPVFRDDYSESAHQQILRSLNDVDPGTDEPYGLDSVCSRAADRIRASFGVPDAAVHFVPTGTIANIIGLGAMLRPFEGVIAARTGHIHVHETGALEAAGHKILTVAGTAGKLRPEDIAEARARYEDEHTVVPRAVYLSQATECGTVYSGEELRTVASHARENQLYTFMDGARLAVAVASGAMTHEDAAVADIFTVGGTKNGGAFGEAVVVVHTEMRPYFRHHIKQRGALLAKGRFIGAQFVRFFDHDQLWLELARHANVMAAALAEGLRTSGATVDPPVVSNQVFVTMPSETVEALERESAFHRWGPPNDGAQTIRLVTSWATTQEAVTAFVSRVEELHSAG